VTSELSEWWSATEIAARVAAGEASARDIVDRYLDRIARVDPELGTYLALDGERARQRATALDQARAAGRRLGPLVGVPFALKDVLVTRDLATTAASKILEGWLPPYDATVVERLHAADAIVLGKANCDEFAMGSSTENSAVRPTRNPWAPTRVPGGSSGGSAAAVAAALCGASLGTDTGGSIRQPAAFCGVVGVKPTYGRVSRHGVVAFASSLDQVGPITRTVADSALVLEVIAGHDPRDSTSLDTPVPRYRDALRLGVDGLRVGWPVEYFPDDLDPEVRAALERARDALKAGGATIVEVTLPHTRLALPTYYIVAPAEASSNLARYDGVRYGHRAVASELEELYSRSRGQGFGREVKRRIMLGTFALRSGYYDAYYKKAQQVRTLIKRDFDEAFTRVDVLLTPTAPTAAFELGARARPIDMYLADTFTLACNLAGLPGMSVPCGITSGGLPLGAQLLAPPLGEQLLFRAATVIEATDPLRGARPGVAA
jgi:aspartyl-tRNA(Asn)/glutamyl-tRNA(Gln) amidotransferase subunit A